MDREERHVELSGRPDVKSKKKSQSQLKYEIKNALKMTTTHI